GLRLLSVTAASIATTWVWLRHHHRRPGRWRHLSWRHNGRSLHPRLLHHLTLLLHLHLLAVGLALLPHLLPVELLLLHLLLLALGLALLFHLLAHRLVLLRPGGPLFSSLLPGLPAVGLLLLFVLLTGSPILLGCLLAF